MKKENKASIPWEPRPKGSSEILWRYSGNPLTNYDQFDGVHLICNSAVIRYQGSFLGVFRGDGTNGMPRLYLGKSKDGLKWNFDPKPIDLADKSDPHRGLHSYGYDPRVVKLEGEDRYIVMWCNDYHGPTIGLAETKDFKKFSPLENAFLPYNRNGVLFPRKIKGNYAMLSRPSDTGHTPFGDIFYSESPDLNYWGKHRHVMGKGPVWWKGLKVGPGPIPIETKDGWLMIYHGVCNTCNGYVYRMSAALLDLDEPWKMLHCAEEFFFGPKADYETTGFVPNVTFPCAVVVDDDGDRIAVYYGSADTRVAVAFGRISELVNFAKTH